MRYDDPELQDRLAAQYALGALSGLVRRRLEALMRDRPALQARVAAWQEQLSPLADAATASAASVFWRLPHGRFSSASCPTGTE